MPTYVGLLRGVNLGSARKVPMAELRDVVEGLGHTDVSTFIQSGNVIFTSAKKVTPASLESALADRFGFDIPVMLRTRAELKKVVDNLPFSDASDVHVGFMARKPTAAAVKKLDGDDFLPEEFVIRGSDLYLHLPNGMARTKLPAYLDRQLGIPTTIRTWKTVTKLLDLAGD